MKKLYKKFIAFMAMVMLLCSTVFTIGCADIKTLEVRVRIYDYENEQVLEGDDYVLTIDLYRHLAPKTVDAIIDYVEEGYYDGSLFYQMTGLDYDTSHSLKKILVGDLKYVNGEITEVVKPEIEGEFEANGIKGNNLLNNLGSIGLFRGANVSDATYKTSSSARNSARATWYIPTKEIKDYDGQYCVFGKFDVEEESNARVIEALNKVFDTSSSNFDTYQVYYTGTYDETKANESYGLKFNCVLSKDYVKDDIEDLHDVEEGEIRENYNPHKVYLPKMVNGAFGASIVSVKVK